MEMRLALPVPVYSIHILYYQLWQNHTVYGTYPLGELLSYALLVTRGAYSMTGREM